jgi:hypothetical protein
MHDYSCVAWQQTSYISVLFFDADRIENSFPTTVACISVYKAVAWQRVDQICYILASGFLPQFCLHFSLFLPQARVTFISSILNKPQNNKGAHYEAPHYVITVSSSEL